MLGSQNVAANLEVATGSAARAANPAAAASGWSQDIAALILGALATLTALHFCPVPGCLSAAGGRRPGWETDGQGLRNHVDAHLLGQLPGLPPETWMNNRRTVICKICGRMVSRRCNNGMHCACVASESAPPLPSFTLASMRIRTGEAIGDLPTLMNVFAARIETREFVGASLFLAVEREFNKCTANVIAHSRPDAWQHIDTPADSLDHLRARSVDRMIYVWTAGERMYLWLEGMKMTRADQPPRKARKRPHTVTDDEAKENGAKTRNEAKSFPWRAKVCLAKLCSLSLFSCYLLFFPFLCFWFRFFLFNCFSSCLPFLCFSFFASFFLFLSLVSFFQSSEQTPNPEKHRREVLAVKITIFLCGHSTFGARWTAVTGIARLRASPLSCLQSFFIFCFVFEQCFFIFFKHLFH